MVESGYRLLIVMRHAKTEQEAASDRVRRLTSRGRRDARAAGVWLRDGRLRPTLTLTSPAARALATAEVVCEEVQGDAPVVIDDLYGASEQDVVELLAAHAGDAETVLVVGHNPTMADLAFGLQRDPDNPWAPHLPTAGLAVLGLPLAWADLELGTADLLHWHVPRG